MKLKIDYEWISIVTWNHMESYHWDDDRMQLPTSCCVNAFCVYAGFKNRKSVG